MDILESLATDKTLLENGGGVADVQTGPPKFVVTISFQLQLTIDRSGDTAPVFHAEFGRFMLEATPGKPWGIGFKDLLDVEPNMKLRYHSHQRSCLSIWH